MREKKYTLFHFSTGDFKGVEEYLDRQAARGWELVKTGLLLARWRRTERKDLVWCVDLADPRQEREERQDYLDLCGEGGWELAALVNGMYLFRSRPGERAIPVQTDPELEKKNYNKYYIRSSILSVLVVLAWLGVYALMWWSLDTDWSRNIQELRYSWFESWTVTALLWVLPLWGLAALWRLGDFAGALVRNRDGTLRAPRPWLVWTNGIVGAAVVVSALLVVLTAELDCILTGSSSLSLLILPVVYGGWALYKAFELEKDQFPGERRNFLRLGVGMALLTAAVVVAMVLSPYGEWSSYGGDEGAELQYRQTETVPLVRSEDLGLPLGERDFFDLSHTMTPMGEHWEIGNYYWSDGLWTTGCETYQPAFVWQAKWLVRTKLEEMEWSAGSNSLFAIPGADMEPVELAWADEAWYGEVRWAEGEHVASVLVLRKGTLVCCLTAPVELWTEEGLSAVRARLGL